MSVNSDGGGGGVKVETDSGATNEGKSLQADQCKKLLVDGPCVFSKSILWKIQREFYESHGVQCWQQVCMRGTALVVYVVFMMVFGSLILVQ